MTQADIDSFIKPPAPGSLVARFEEFHRRNPRVYAEMVDVCRELKSSGVRLYSIAGVFEIVRYQRAVGIRPSAERFALSNDFKPLYADMVMARNADLRGFFRISGRKKGLY